MPMMPSNSGGGTGQIGAPTLVRDELEERREADDKEDDDGAPVVDRSWLGGRQRSASLADQAVLPEAAAAALLCALWPCRAALSESPGNWRPVGDETEVGDDVCDGGCDAGMSRAGGHGCPAPAAAAADEGDSGVSPAAPWVLKGGSFDRLCIAAFARASQAVATAEQT
mmetsp:Transcript_94950/g.212066  ORF Transcript_94950/g.212066 Transcript_94950/m.212066 type:complete len:169 (+) Transcript_94950:1952-2458(+)